VSDQQPHVEQRKPNVHEASLDAAQAAQRMAEATHASVQDLRDLARRGLVPARLEPIALSAINNGQKLDAIGHAPEGQPDVSLAIGLLNPYTSLNAPANTSAGDVFLGLGGMSASPGALVVPAGKLLVLPIAAGDVEIGLPNPPPDSAPVRVWLLRFAAPQPFYYGPGPSSVSDDVTDRALRQLGLINPGLADSIGNFGSVATPLAGQVIVAIPAPGAGAYDIEVHGNIAGIATGDYGNPQLRHGANVIAPLYFDTPANGRAIHHFRRITVAAGENIDVNVAAAGTAGTTYRAELIVTRVA